MIAKKSKSIDITPPPLWEDKLVRFDVPHLQNRLRNGEKILVTIYHIDDSKGNPGDNGCMLVTNLRLIWYSRQHKQCNLSIGYGRIITITKRTVFCKAKGTSQALYILAAGEVSRFEFLFTDVSTETRSCSIFDPIYDVHNSYQRTVLYRELKLRSAILRSRHLILLPQEQVYSNLSGVWNLSSDQGNLGSFFVTNIRVVWYADINENFNISLPYMQISSIKIRDSKYGDALVIQTVDTAGGYILGFRIDPAERLCEIYKELLSLFQVYSKTPNFGIYYVSKEADRPLAFVDKNNVNFKIDDFPEIDAVQEKEINSRLTSYLAEGYFTQTRCRKPIYCKELGLAIEQLREGYNLSELWQITLNNSFVVE